MERPRAGGAGDLDLGGRRAREWKAKVEGINRGDQTAYGVAISLPRGREQLLDHGSKPLEGAPPATERPQPMLHYIIFRFGGLWDVQVTMRDLPGFVWDEERQRYFALQSEPVARSLQQ